MLLDHIHNKYKRVAIVGMAKNSGKTVVLNHLIKEATERDIRLGIMSTGRDGESIDLVTEGEKPKILVHENTIIVTTTELLPLGEATIEIIYITDYKTPLGRILVGKVKAEGYIEIAGPQTVKGIREVADLMIKLGAELVIIDGALDRRAAASPSISQATILSTGAVISRDINRVVEETIHITNLFRLPRLEDKSIRQAMKKTMENKQISIVDGEFNLIPTHLKTALNSGHIIGQYMEGGYKYILIPSSLVKKTLEDIISSTNKYSEGDIVVADGSKIFIPSKDWLRFAEYGFNIKVLNPINLVAITLNPYGPQGYYFNPRELLDRTRYHIKDIPVVDLMSGG